MTTATSRLLDALRAANSDCTDYRAGKLLGVSTSAVSRWRLGQSHMNMANVSRACELAGIPEQTWEWQIRVGAEREKTADGDIYREALKDLESYRASGEPSPNGLFALLTRGGRAAAILAPVLFVLLGVLTPEQPASAATPTPVATSEQSILRQIRRRRSRRWISRRWRHFLTWFPNATLARCPA